MAIKYGAEYHYFALGMILLSAVSVGILFFYLKTASVLGADQVVVEKISGKDAEAMGYVVTYLIPFLDIKLNEPSTFVSLLLLFLVVAVVYVHSNLIYVNPTLNVMKYHLFEVEMPSGKTAALLSKRSFVERGSTISVISLGDQVLLETPYVR